MRLFKTTTLVAALLCALAVATAQAESLAKVKLEGVWTDSIVVKGKTIGVTRETVILNMYDLPIPIKKVYSESTANVEYTLDKEGHPVATKIKVLTDPPG